MPFFHVLVQYRNGADKTHCVFSDLSEKEVKARFVRPYLKGERIQSGTDVIDVMEITCVRVIETAESNDEERAKLHASEQERIDAINRAPNGIRFLALAGGYEPEDIVDAGPDVTSRFISAAPGSNQGNVLIRAVHNPWVVGVGAGGDKCSSVGVVGIERSLTKHRSGRAKECSMIGLVKTESGINCLLSASPLLRDAQHSGARLRCMQ